MQSREEILDEIKENDYAKDYAKHKHRHYLLVARVHPEHKQISLSDARSFREEYTNCLILDKELRVDLARA